MMRTLTAMVALLSLLSNALAAPTVARSETTDRGRYDHFDNFPSGKVISRNVVVFIPYGPPPDSGYAVLYMHDGHNLFDPAQAMGHEPWAADQAIAQGHFPLILVAIDNTSLRWPEYVPLTAYAALPEELALAAQGRIEALYRRALSDPLRCDAHVYRWLFDGWFDFDLRHGKATGHFRRGRRTLDSLAGDD